MRDPHWGLCMKETGDCSTESPQPRPLLPFRTDPVVE